MLKKVIALALVLTALCMSLASCAREDAGAPQSPPPAGTRLPDKLSGTDGTEAPEGPETTEPPEATKATEPETTQTPELPDDYGKGDPPLPEIPPYNGPFDPAEYGDFLSKALGKAIPLWGRFPFSAVFIYFPEIDPSLEGWTVYIAQPSARNLTEMTAEDLVPLAQTLTLPGNINFDSARPVYVGSGGGSGELEIVVELVYHDKTTYISWDNFTWTNEDDALTLVYRGPLPDERVKELREEGLIP